MIFFQKCPPTRNLRSEKVVKKEPVAYLVSLISLQVKMQKCGCGYLSYKMR